MEPTAITLQNIHRTESPYPPIPRVHGMQKYGPLNFLGNLTYQVLSCPSLPPTLSPQVRSKTDFFLVRCLRETLRMLLDYQTSRQPNIILGSQKKTQHFHAQLTFLPMQILVLLKEHLPVGKFQTTSIQTTSKTNSGKGTLRPSPLDFCLFLLH